MFVDWSRICLSRLREFLWKGNIPRNPDASGTYAPETDSQHLHALGGTKHHNKVLYEWTCYTGINSKVIYEWTCNTGINSKVLY